MEFLLDKKYSGRLRFLRIACLLAAFGFTGLLFVKNGFFDDWEAKRELTLYNAPMLFLLFWWIKCRLQDAIAFQWKMIGIDCLMLSLVAVRLIDLSYHSGHVLFLVYTMVTTSDRTYRMLALPMVVLIIYFKFFVWGDFITPPLGVILAIGLIYFRK